MLCSDDVTSSPARFPWRLTDDQQRLRDTAQRFARDRLVPLLTHPASTAGWRETVRLAGALDLATMILPAHQDGMAIDHHDLCLVIEQFASGPLERAAELTLSVPALMFLRRHDALEHLPASSIHDYLNGETSISLSVPGTQASTAWLLQLHADAPTLMMHGNASRCAIVLAGPDALRRATQRRRRIAAFAALGLEQITVDQAALASCPRIAPCCENQDVRSMPGWLIETGLYLCALLSGAMQHSVAFATGYAASRHTFRKPLGAHQLNATRLADMLVATHATGLLLRTVTADGASAPAALVRQLLRHVAAEAMDVSRELVQLCGGHGYVEGLPPSARFQTIAWFASLLLRTDAALAQHITPGLPCPDPGALR